MFHEQISQPIDATVKTVDQPSYLTIMLWQVITLAVLFLLVLQFGSF